MAERTTPFRSITNDAEDAINRVKAEVDQLVDSIDIKQLGQRVQEFGAEKPLALALAAFTIGLAAGMLVNRGTQDSSLG